MYNYQEIKPSLFTEDGQVLFLKIRDKTKHLIKTAGAFRMQEAIADCTGSSWDFLACVDRLVELGEIREITKQGEVAGQCRVFVSTQSPF